MLKAERLEVIKKLAKENEIISWEDLRAHLYASKATIWRDVEELEARGLAEKVRGGVAFPRKDRMETPNEVRRYFNPEAKVSIARKALSYISDNDFIMLDSGSTVLELAKQIPEEMNIGIVTYYYETARAVSALKNSEVFLLGGELRKGFDTVHGYMAEKMLESFHARTCFLGADGVDIENGLTSFNSMDVPLKQRMIEQSDQVILLCDHSKFEIQGFVHIAPVEKADIIITDPAADEHMIRALQEKNVKVVIAD